MEIYNGSYSVYIHYFPNNKVYVGITKKPPQQRWGSDGKGYVLQPLMWAAIQKYGWDNIQHEIVANHLTRAEAEATERLLIKQLHANDREYGYNIESGGLHGATWCSEKEEKQILQSWYEGNTIIDIANQTKHCTNLISNILKSQGVTDAEIEQRRRKRIGEVSTRYNKQEILELYNNGLQQKDIAKKLGCSNYTITAALNENNIDKTERLQRGKIKPVEQYTLDGEYIKTWNCAADALEELTGSRKRGHIVDVCKGRRTQTLGYFWKYAD